MVEDKADVVVRRRAAVMAAIALTAAMLAAGYAWRFSATAGSGELFVAILLGVIALCYSFAWVDARTPVLVADSTGLRIRLGAAWTGVAWESIDSVEVEERGWLRDGQVIVNAAQAATRLNGTGRRSRWAAALNRWLYDAALVAPFGLSTSASTSDLKGSLERLAAGRAEVILRDGEEREPEPTVEVSPMFGFSEGWQVIPEAPSDSAGRHSSAAGGPVPRPRRRLFPARPNGVSTNGATTTVAYKSTSARRADVTLPLRREPATLGASALANTPDSGLGSGQTNGQPASDVPVASQTATLTEEPDVGSSNIALIIDSTTDLSLRAMQKVRTAPPAGVPVQQAAPEEAVLATERVTETVIGGQLVRARATLGLTVDELAERTRIRPSVIEAIEVDDFAPCGGDFYAKGHLRMLARVMGIDAAPLLTAYDDHFAASPINARDVFEVELATRARGSVKDDTRGRRGALIGTVVLLMLVWGGAAYFAGDDPASERQGVAPTQLGPTFKQTGLTPPEPRSPEPRDNGGDAAQAQVMVSASGGSSRVVVMDGSRTVLFRGVLSDGAGQKFSGEAPLRVRAADGGVISLSVRGKYLGYVGVAGLPGHQIVRASQVPDRR